MELEMAKGQATTDYGSYVVKRKMSPSLYYEWREKFLASQRRSHGWRHG